MARSFQRKNRELCLTRMKQIITILIALVLFGCEKNDVSLEGNAIDSKIAIETREVLEPGNRRITFLCKTERIYPCVNFPLHSDKESSESSLAITFTSVEQTDLCLTALGPATAWIDAGPWPNGEYDIEFNNARLANKGKLIVTDSDIELRFPHQRGISIVREVTKRIPEKTYWGVIGYHDKASETLVNEFIQKFKELGADFANQVPGHYFYYEIDATGKRVYDTSKSGYWFAIPFVFQFHGDESELKKLIQVEGNAYRAELSISAENYRGEQVNNWIR